MRNIVEFRGYRTRVEFDPKDQRFVYRHTAQGLHDADTPARKSENGTRGKPLKKKIRNARV
jgi:hypothetical protein